MILGMQIGMIVVALMTLATGRLTLSSTRVVVNPLASKLALILLAPMPLVYTAHGFVHHYFVTHNKPVSGDSFTWTMIAVAGAITLLCLAAAYGIGWAVAVDPKTLAADAETGASETGARVPEAPDMGTFSRMPATPIGGNFSRGVQQDQQEERKFKALLQGKPEPPPQAVCQGCGHPIRVADGERLPPWCPKCGKNLT